MNMFQLQERIKDFSKDQLVQEMQQPSGAVPPFLVLSELQRRTRMEKAFQAEQAQGQQSTVAQDAIAAAGVPQGGIADMARAMAPQTDMTGNTGAMPVQNMYGGGEVKRMEPGGLLRSTGNAELDAALAELERQRIRQAEVLRSLGLQGDEEGLSGVSADVGSFAPGALGGFGIGGAAPDSLSRVDPNVAAPRTAPGLPSIRPTDAQPILNEQAPPAFRDLAGPATVVGPEQGPQLPATGAPTDFPAQLINRDGERLVLLPDGSAVSPEQLGITPGDLAGAGTADLAGPAAFTDPIYPAFPTQSDLDLRVGGEQRDTAARDAATAADVEADTARRFIAQTFENEANRDTVEKLITPIPEPELPPMQGPEYMSLFDQARLAAEKRRSRPESEVPSEFTALPDFMTDPSVYQGEPYTRVADLFGLGPAIDLIPTADAGAEDAIVPLTPDADTPRPVPRPDRSTTPPAGGGAGGTGGGAGGGAGARSTSTADADKWLALAQFGLGLMSSQQPTLGGAIGEAGTAALGQLSAARKEAYERDLAERTLAARSAGRPDRLSLSDRLDYITEQMENTRLAISMEPDAGRKMDLANDLASLQEQAAAILGTSGPATARAAEGATDVRG